MYEENGTAEDLYDMEQIVATQRVQINSVSIRGLCERENDTQVCTVEMSLRPAAATSRVTAVNLTTTFTEYLGTWTVNPEDDLLWTIAALNAIEAGCQLVSGGAGCEARCTQLYAWVDVSILGEYISNFSPFYKDAIHVDQGFSVIAQEDQSRALWNATTVQINYKAPDGTLGNIMGNILEGTKVIAPVTAALNNQTGKWWFKLYVVLATGEILEGIPFFVNVEPRWL